MSMENELFWQAVQSNDSRFDGAFYVGVRTTGIYCKPSCRARLPKRENVAFYETTTIAERNGLRACLRCRPDEIDSIDPQVKRVLTVCSVLDSDESHSLNSIAAELGMSPFHLQKSFKSIVGVSPKKYSEAKRMEKFKNGLRDGSDVTAAMYDAGYGSSSRLYEKASESMGMTPSAYQKGGKGMKINYVVTECELGRMLVARTPRGVCSVRFGDSDNELETHLAAEFPNASITCDDSDLQSVVESIIKCLTGDNVKFTLPLDLQATSFQLRVWEALRAIPAGETRSYSDIAEVLGDKRKVRAVAQACARNRVAVVIPCHRVIASNGKLSGYRWGIERKQMLLDNERRSKP